MKRSYSFFIAAVVTLSCTLLASAGDVKVIVNRANAVSALSSEELKRVFLGTKTSLDDGTRVEPVIKKDGMTHEEFVKKYLGKTSTALETYYRSLVFTGKGSMPKSFESDAQVVAYVAKTKGAIGYVSMGTSTPGVKTIDIR